MNKKKLHRASFRRSRKIDYTKKRVMNRRKREILAIRAAAAAGSWVVGYFTRNGEGVLAFKAVKQQPTHQIDMNQLETYKIDEYYRWATRQGAHHWVNRRGIIAPFAVRNLASLLPPAAALTTGKPGREPKGRELRQKFIAKKQTVASGH